MVARRADLARGQVWWTEPPDEGRRPGLVLHREGALRALPRVLVVPATTHVRGLDTEVPLGPEDGLPRDCVLSVDTPALLYPSYLVEYVTTLGPQRMEEVCRALAVTTGCR